MKMIEKIALFGWGKSKRDIDEALPEPPGGFDEPPYAFWHADANRKGKKIRMIFGKPDGLSWSHAGKYSLSFKDLNSPTSGVYSSEKDAKHYLKFLRAGRGMKKEASLGKNNMKLIEKIAFLRIPILHDPTKDLTPYGRKVLKRHMREGGGTKRPNELDLAEAVMVEEDRLGISIPNDKIWKPKKKKKKGWFGK